MSDSGDAEAEGSSTTQLAEGGKNESKKKIIRLLTVMAYVSSVSGSAFMLSMYYLFLWEPKVAEHHLKANPNAHQALALQDHGREAVDPWSSGPRDPWPPVPRDPNFFAAYRPPGKFDGYSQGSYHSLAPLSPVTAPDRHPQYPAYWEHAVSGPQPRRPPSLNLVREPAAADPLATQSPPPSQPPLPLLRRMAVSTSPEEHPPSPAVDTNPAPSLLSRSSSVFAELQSPQLLPIRSLLLPASPNEKAASLLLPSTPAPPKPISLPTVPPPSSAMITPMSVELLNSTPTAPRQYPTSSARAVFASSILPTPRPTRVNPVHVSSPTTRPSSSSTTLVPVDARPPPPSSSPEKRAPPPPTAGVKRVARTSLHDDRKPTAPTSDAATAAPAGQTEGPAEDPTTTAKAV